MPWRSLRAASRAFAARKLPVTVEGGQHLPASGPVVIAARHYHHLYDGVGFVTTIPRPLHVLVTVDWLKGGIGRKGLEAACRAARWPAVVRTDAFTAASHPVDPREAQRIFRRAVADAVAILKDGRVLLIFPEGYPTIDPNPTPKAADDELLPFLPGAARIARIAERSGAGSVPIVPAGLVYRREPGWQLTIRYGEPVLPSDDTGAVTVELERRVRQLSGLAA